MKYDILLAYPEPASDSPLKLTPLSILFPGALFESQGKKVAYFDERFDSPQMLDELIKDSQEIGVSSFTGYQVGRAARILKRAKAINPGIVTGLGGFHARLLPEQVLSEPFVDKVWTEISYGEDLFPYAEETKIHYQRTDMQYFTSRGCPFPCTFCAIKTPWMPKEIKQLEYELKTLRGDIGFSEISFSDPNIIGGNFGFEDGSRISIDRLSRIKQIGKIMRAIDVKWDGNLRSPYLTEEMVEALVDANCYSIEIGCESGNDWFLKKVIKKGHGTDAIKQAVKNVRGSGISIMYSFMANMPGETREMLHETMDLIDWIVANDPDGRVSIYNYAPYPGTPLYESAVEGLNGYPRFDPPASMEEWGNLRLMKSPLYWIAGMCFRKDNTRKNFPGEDWDIIEPYIKLAEQKWKNRDIDEYPSTEVEELIAKQQAKNTAI